jgi:hypothetical protein
MAPEAPVAAPTTAAPAPVGCFCPRRHHRRQHDAIHGRTPFVVPATTSGGLNPGFDSHIGGWETRLTAYSQRMRESRRWVRCARSS